LIHRRSSLIIISFNSPFSAAAADGLKGNGANFLNEAGMKRSGGWMDELLLLDVNSGGGSKIWRAAASSTKTGTAAFFAFFIRLLASSTLAQTNSQLPWRWHFPTLSLPIPLP
jgi:hypothetical protein